MGPVAEGHGRRPARRAAREARIRTRQRLATAAGEKLTGEHRAIDRSRPRRDVPVQACFGARCRLRFFAQGAPAVLRAKIAGIMEENFSGSTDPGVLAYHYTEAASPEQASAYWLSAGRASLEKFALTESMRQLRLGLEQIANMPLGTTRDRRELAHFIRTAPHDHHVGVMHVSYRPG